MPSGARKNKCCKSTCASAIHKTMTKINKRALGKVLFNLRERYI